MSTGYLMFLNLTGPDENTLKKARFVSNFYVMNVLHFRLIRVPAEKHRDPRRSD